MLQSQDENIEEGAQTSHFWSRLIWIIVLILIIVFIINTRKRYVEVKQNERNQAIESVSATIPTETVPSVMDYYKTIQPSEPIKFENGVAHRIIKVEFIIEEDCGVGFHCVSYIKEENGPHFTIGSMYSPYNFRVGKSYDCELSPDDSGFTAAVIDSCK